ncbi:MAG TPA: FG-GAP-like repeat-containing protein, partial [Cyclobacteriaceae bacterium]
VDLFVGGSYSNDLYGANPSGEFFQNQGTSTSPNFVSYEHNGLSFLYLSEAALTFADIDNDGDKDVFAGSSNNYIRCFRQDIENTLTELTGIQNPFGNFAFGNYTSPAAADFDKDGDLDFIVASDPNYSFWGPDDSNLHYVENTGNFALEDKTGLNLTPFDGVDVGREAVPVFVDLDGDNDLDVLIGSKYSNPLLFVYTNVNGTYKADPDHPLVDALSGLGFSSDVIPVFADIDNDGDKDLFLCRGDEISFFRKTGGGFVNEPTLFPTVNNTNSYEVSLAFLDLDNDGDLDAFVGNFRSGQPDVVYFRNSGTATAPNFVSTTPPAPFDTPNLFEDEVNFSAVDLDNDGDTDLVVTHTYYNGWYGDSDASEVLFFENKNNGTFVEAAAPLIKELTPKSFTSFVDIDGDGDLDAFVGNGDSFYFDQNGKVFFFENTNPAPVTSIASSVLVVTGGEPTILDPDLTIVDSDNDDIVNAVITISDYVEGDEELSFDEAIAQANGITGSFDNESGVLTLTGRATIAVYQSLLRTVSINFTGAVPGGRKSSAGKTKAPADLAQQITFQVRDTDFTLTTVSIVTLNINVVSGSEIIVFNAISPGDTERNQFFEIRNIESVSPENKVTIYNRWGDIVFEVSGYNNSDAAKRFNGVSKNDKDLPTGTYFYKIETSGNTITGYLSLKR